MNNLSNGGRDIIKSGKQGTLVRLNSQEHYVCYSCGYPIFSLSPKQLELLYTENETEWYRTTSLFILLITNFRREPIIKDIINILGIDLIPHYVMKGEVGIIK